MFINNEGQPDTNRRYRDLAIELRARAPGKWTELNRRQIETAHTNRLSRQSGPWNLYFCNFYLSGSP